MAHGFDDEQATTSKLQSQADMSCRVTEEANVSCGVEMVICACVFAITGISHGYGDSDPHTFVGDASRVIEAM